MNKGTGHRHRIFVHNSETGQEVEVPRLEDQGVDPDTYLTDGERRALNHTPATKAAEKAEKAGRNGNIPPRQHRFKPGQSGNPSGRPKYSLTKKLLEKLAGDNSAWGDALIHGLVQQAVLGNRTALRIIFERIEGPVGTNTNEED